MWRGEAPAEGEGNMKILIFSDTHGSFAEMKKVIAEEKPIDVLAHCGDICGLFSSALGKTDYQIRAVRGNCDYDTSLPETEVVELLTHKALLVHGHLHMVDNNNRYLVKTAKENGCDLALYGHTHVPEVVTEDGVLVINPGSLVRPRTRDGKGSYAVLTIDDATGRMDAVICYI